MTATGITIDKDLKFDKHVNKICLKINRKLINVLSRMWSFLSEEKIRMIFLSLLLNHNSYFVRGTPVPPLTQFAPLVKVFVFLSLVSVAPPFKVF